MRLLYSKTGFEQDFEPQICLKGSTIELAKFIHELKEYLSSCGSNVIRMNLSIQADDFDVEFYIKENDTVLTKIDAKKIIISLDKKYWYEIINMIYPLTKKTGYQFIEFDNHPLFYNATLIFSCISSH